MIDELTREHTQALHHLRTARTAIAAADLPSAAHQSQLLLELLAPHTAVEEQTLFPAALISLSAADWEAAEQVRRLVGTALRPVAHR